MHIVILSFFLFILTASGQECDPVEAERQCYEQLCRASSAKIIPTDPEELLAVSESHSYELPDEIRAEWQKMSSISESIIKSSRELLSQNKGPQIVDELLAHPIRTYRSLEVLFNGEFICLEQNGICDLISNDLSSYPPGMSDFFKRLHDKTFVFRKGASLSLKRRKELLLESLKELSIILPEKIFQAEKKRIKKIKNEGDFIQYSLNIPWKESFEQKITKDLMPFKEDFFRGLTIRMEELIFKSSGVRGAERLKKSCQLASYLQKKVTENSSEAKFEKTKAAVINRFKAQFIPKLSTDSGRKLLEVLETHPFDLIKLQSDYHPYSVFLGRHSQGFSSPQNGFDLVSDLALLQSNQSYLCQTKSFFPADAFNFGTGRILVSPFALANDHDDAITHEMGHWLSLQLKEKRLSRKSHRKLLAVRKCVSGFYPPEKKTGFFHLFRQKGDGQRTEEDFADWFVSQAGFGGSGLYCDLKKLTLSLVGQNRQSSSYLPEEGGIHSSLLFRELHLRLNRGEAIPSVCTELMGAYSFSPARCEL